jgi:galactofuranose transport system permease protein
MRMLDLTRPTAIMSTAELAPDRRTLGRDEVLDWFTERGVYVGLLLLIAFNLVFTPRFAEIDNIRLQFVQVVPVAIIALGMALVIGTRGIDLSVGSVMAIASALLALYLGYGPIVAITIALIGGVAVGIVNGVLISRFGIQPIVATLALLVGGRGLALVIAQGRLTEVFDPTLGAIGSNRFFGIPFVVLITLGVALIVAILVARTTFGRYVVAIGGNPEASVLAGVPVRRTLIAVYVLSGLLAALAGIVQTARLSASDPSFVGNLIELSAITAVVVGGTPLSGGRVRILGTLAGAMLMQLIAATLITHDLPDSATRMVQAVIILGAVFLQRQRNPG